MGTINDNLTFHNAAFFRGIPPELLPHQAARGRQSKALFKLLCMNSPAYEAM
jgi:hypothetical protein